MGLPVAAREFDDLADVYDATRPAPSRATIERLGEEFDRVGVRSLLEVGVGTGRIAGPLGDTGRTVVGVDAARRMLARARAKGISRLLQGSAYRLPFPDRTFDAALFVHVLHVLDRPREALVEAGRVVRAATFALVQPSRERPSDSDGPDRPMRRLAEELAARGYPRGPGRGPPGRRESELLAAYPPRASVALVDEEVTEPLARRLDFVAQRASRHYRDVPPDVLAAAVARVREQVGDRTRTYRRRELLVRWDPGDGPVTPRTGGP